MWETLLNIDISRGFWRKSIIADAAEISKCCKCCRILICLVDFGEHQILQMMPRIENSANAAEY